jgi:hypothetical protein
MFPFCRRPSRNNYDESSWIVGEDAHWARFPTERLTQGQRPKSMGKIVLAPKPSQQDRSSQDSAIGFDPGAATGSE